MFKSCHPPYSFPPSRDLFMCFSFRSYRVKTPGTTWIAWSSSVLRWVVCMCMCVSRMRLQCFGSVWLNAFVHLKIILLLCLPTQSFPQFGRSFFDMYLSRGSPLPLMWPADVCAPTGPLTLLGVPFTGRFCLCSTLWLRLDLRLLSIVFNRHVTELLTNISAAIRAVIHINDWIWTRSNPCLCSIETIFSNSMLTWLFQMGTRR